MTLLAYPELLRLIEDGVINANPDRVNAASIDITLGNIVHVENETSARISLGDRQAPSMRQFKMGTGGCYLKPGAFALCNSNEVFNLPDNISCEYKLTSSLARSGLDHANAGWCDAGWYGSVLTLEFKNLLQYQTLILSLGMKCGEMVFFKHITIPERASYRNKGQYNQDKTAQVSKGNR